jgi:hypothetical protein
VLTAYLAWTGRVGRYWSSYGTAVAAEGGKYYFVLEGLYVGRQEDDGDFGSLLETMALVQPDKIVFAENLVFDRFLDKLEHQTPEAVYTASKQEPMVSVFLNSSVVTSPDTAKMFTRY